MARQLEPMNGLRKRCEAEFYFKNLANFFRLAAVMGRNPNSRMICSDSATVIVPVNLPSMLEVVGEVDFRVFFEVTDGIPECFVEFHVTHGELTPQSPH